MTSVWHDLYQALKDLQVLVGGLLAFGAAAIALIGVSRTIKANMLNGELDREHRTKIAEQERIAALEHRRKAVLHAVSGEVYSIHKITVNLLATLEIQAKVVEEYEKNLPGQPMQVPTVPVIATPIFDAFVGDIGLLPPTLTASIASVYGTVKAYGRADIDEKFETKLLSAYLVFLIGSLEGLRDDAHDLILRMHFVRTGNDDPGANKGSEFYKLHFESQGPTGARTEA